MTIELVKMKQSERYIEQYQTEEAIVSRYLHPLEKKELDEDSDDVFVDVKNSGIDCFLVYLGSEIVGYVMVDDFYKKMSSRFGYSLYANKPISYFANKKPFIVHAKDDNSFMIKQALERPESEKFDVIFVKNHDDNPIGYLTIADLLMISVDIQQLTKQKQQQYFTYIEGHIDHIENSISDLRKTNEEGNELSDKMLSTTEAGNEQLSRVVSQLNKQVERIEQQQKDFQLLNNLTTEINTIVKTIRGISEKVNILSLNAAVEAARAGEYGKSFAVVASEIRKLADETKKSTSSIGDFIDEMVRSIKKIDQEQHVAHDQMHHSHELIHDLNTNFDLLKEHIQYTVKGIGTMSEKTEVAKVITYETKTSLKKLQKTMEYVKDEERILME